jgi:hypothetical protein
MSQGRSPTDAEPLSPEPGLQLELPLLGVPLLFRSNSQAVIASVASAFGRWRALPPRPAEPGPPGLVEIVVQPRAGAEPPGQATLRTHGDTLLAARGASLLLAQVDQGRALALVTPGLAADALLAALRQGRTPLAAAGVAHRGRAALLVGASAPERAALLAACLHAGMALLANETAYLDREAAHVWGHAGPLLLPAEAARRSPARGTPQPDGALLIEPDALDPTQLALHAAVGAVCIVEHGAGQASQAEPLAPGAATTALLAAQDARFTLLRARAATTAAALAAGRVYRLSLGSDAASAAALLAHLLR